MKKIVKTVCIVFVALIVAATLWLANGFLGNPISAGLGRAGLKRYLQENYPAYDLKTERFGYNFKTGGYFAYVASDTSIDTAFYINLDMLGRVSYDSFDTWVTGKMNTEQRVQEQYRILVDGVLENPSFPYESDILGGMLDFQQDREVGDGRDYSYAISMEELIPDKEYSREEILSFGSRAGILTIYVQEEIVTAQRAAEIMLDIKNLFDEAGVSFYRMDLVLQYPKPEEGPWPEEDIRAELVNEEIYPEGLEDRIQESHDQIYAYFAELDKLK